MLVKDRRRPGGPRCSEGFDKSGENIIEKKNIPYCVVVPWQPLLIWKIENVLNKLGNLRSNLVRVLKVLPSILCKSKN